MQAEQRLNALLSTLFSYILKLVLTAVGALALMGIAQLVGSIVQQGEVRLEDLLLMFIYIEIMAMTHVYFVRSAVPFTYPMFIAVTALSRLIVLQGKDIAMQNLLYEGGAILLVSIAILIVRYSEHFGVDAATQSSHHESLER